MMSIRLSVSLCLLLAFSSHAQGRQYVGFSSFAALNPKYPCNRYLTIAKKAKSPAMTVLLSTFGNDLTCVSKFLTTFKRKPHLLQIHLSNETCRRHIGRCTKEEITPTLTTTPYNKALQRGNLKIKRAIQNRVLFVKDKILPLTNKRTKVIVSTGLEDNYNNKAYVKVLSYVKEVLSKTNITRSPVADRCYLLNGANYCELHSTNSNFNNSSGKLYPCIWNNDGNINSTYDQLKLFHKFRKCSVLFSWEPTSQGRGNGAKYLEPSRRSFTISSSVIKKYSNLINLYQSNMR